MMNVSTEINQPMHPLSRAKATTQAGESRIGQGSVSQMMNVSTLIDKAIHPSIHWAPFPRKSYLTTQAGKREREGEGERVREQMMNVSTLINQCIHPSIQWPLSRVKATKHLGTKSP